MCEVWKTSEVNRSSLLFTAVSSGEKSKVYREQWRPRHPLLCGVPSSQMQEAVVVAALPTTVLIHVAMKQLIAGALLVPVNVNSETAPTEFS